MEQHQAASSAPLYPVGVLAESEVDHADEVRGVGHYTFARQGRDWWLVDTVRDDT